MNKAQLSKIKNGLLFVQMILIVILIVSSTYLLIFSIQNHLGGWMITSYAFILLSVVSLGIYGVIGYRYSEQYYILSIVPFMFATFVNILIPTRGIFQETLLILLLMCLLVFTLKQKEVAVLNIVGIGMVAIALIFSIYSSLTANTQFLGDVSTNWPTYAAMYLSIFTPTIVSFTYLVSYNARIARYMNTENEN